MKRLNKRITPETIIASVKKLTEAKIPHCVSFLTGTPRESNEDLLKTLKLMQTIKDVDKNNVCYVQSIQVFRPYPGCPLFDEAIEFGFEVPRTLEGWEKYCISDDTFLPEEFLPWLTPERRDFIKKAQSYRGVFFTDFLNRSPWTLKNKSQIIRSAIKLFFKSKGLVNFMKNFRYIFSSLIFACSFRFIYKRFHPKYRTLSRQIQNCQL